MPKRSSYWDAGFNDIPQTRATGDGGQGKRTLENCRMPQSRTAPQIALSTLGVLYGDIDSSPFCALRESVSSGFELHRMNGWFLNFARSMAVRCRLYGMRMAWHAASSYGV